MPSLCLTGEDVEAEAVCVPKVCSSVLPPCPWVEEPYEGGHPACPLSVAVAQPASCSQGTARWWPTAVHPGPAQGAHGQAFF